jgi:hypothetical protein
MFDIAVRAASAVDTRPLQVETSADFPGAQRLDRYIAPA